LLQCGFLFLNDQRINLKYLTCANGLVIKANN